MLGTWRVAGKEDVGDGVRIMCSVMVPALEAELAESCWAHGGLQVKEAWETVYGIMCTVIIPVLEAELVAKSA
jgi:hypothetical protein